MAGFRRALLWVANRAWDIFINWPFLSALIGGGVMTYATTVQDWMLTNPVSSAVLIIGTMVIVGLAVARIRLWVSRRDVEKANERYIAGRTNGSLVNPMDVIFEGRRIDFRDMTRPLTDEVRNKTFRRCQIVGPTNVILMGSTNLAGQSGIACDAVYCDNLVHVSNAIRLTDCDFRDCEFFNVTFMVGPEDYERFSHAIAVSWITPNPRNLGVYQNGQVLPRQPLLEHQNQADVQPQQAEAGDANGPQ